MTLNANGYLASVTDPGGNVTRYTYAPDGLMTTMTDPNGGVYTFTHDAMGKLTADHNPIGGGWTLTSSKTKTTQTSSITSAEGRTDTTLRELLPTGGERMTLTSPSGAISEILTTLDAKLAFERLIFDGSLHLSILHSDFVALAGVPAVGIYLRRISGYKYPHFAIGLPPAAILN